MHKSIRPIGPALALLLITLIHPASILHAAGMQSSSEALATSISNRPSPAPPVGYTYVVQPDDTLWDIAAAHGISVDALVAANSQIDPRLLRPGQTLFVPAERPASAPKRPVQPSAPGYVYTVQPNDTLWGIAAAHGITVETLVAANKLIDPRRLQAGQAIFVPASPPAAAPAPPAAPAPGTETQPPPAEPGADAAAPPSTETGADAAAPPSTEPGADAAAPPPAEPGADAAAPSPAEPGAEAAALLAAINDKRAAQGLPALAWSAELAAAAQAHAADCAQRNRGSHVGSDGAKLAARLDRAGYPARLASENWANAQSVQHAFALWWNEPRGSDPHRRNILNPKYSEIGIGVAKGAWGYYFVADFAGR